MSSTPCLNGVQITTLPTERDIQPSCLQPGAVIKLLSPLCWRCGANANAKDREGRTALDHARAAQRDEVVELLNPLTTNPWASANVDRLREADPELCAAVVSFIRRAESIGRSGEVQAGEIPNILDTIIPPWYALILFSVPLSGVVFSSPKPERSWVTGGWFRPLGELAKAHSSFYPEIEIIKEGYFAFAGGDNGDLWVVTSNSKPEGPVLLWDLSGMEAVPAYSSFPNFLQQIEGAAD